MAGDQRLEMGYWLYWRAYELYVDEAGFRQRLGAHESLSGRFGRLLAPARAAGLVRKTPDGFEITPAGAYWIHRLQNE